MLVGLLHALLYRWILPVVLLAACILRINGFSLAYLLVLTLLPLLKFGHRSSRQRLLVGILLVVSTVSLLGNAFFQLTRVTDYAARHLQPGNVSERIWRQIGFNQMKEFAPADVARYIVPDVVVFLLSIILLILAVKLGREEAESDGLLEDGERQAASTPYESGVPKWLLSVLYAFSNALCIVVLLCAGAANPSILSAVYLLVVIIVGVCWALEVRGAASKLRTAKIFIIVYSALHFLALYVYQFEGVQSTQPWDPTDFTIPQALGLTPIVNASIMTSRPWTITFSPMAKWTWYLSPAVIFAVFWLVSIDLQFAPSSDASSGSDTPPTNAPYGRRGSPGSERASLLCGAQPSSYGTGSSAPSNLAAISDTDSRDVLVTSATSTESRRQDAIHPAIRAISNFFAAIGQFCIKHSHLVTLFVMMAWSIAYLSWLSCVLLILACILWIVPNRYVWCLNVSPLIAAYGAALLILEYACDFDIITDVWEEWNELGTRHHYIGFPHILIKAAGLGIFLATVKSCTQRMLQQRDMLSGDAAASSRDESTDEADGVSQVMLQVFEAAFVVLRTYWLLVCYGVFLAAGLVGEVSIFKLVYMFLFLVFFITYQLSHRVWSAVVRPLWWLAVLYSMTVLGMIYSFQFKGVRETWEKHVSHQWLHDVGLEQFSQKELFAQLLLPTLVLIAVIIQIQYCHGKSADLDKSGRLSRAGTPSMGVKNTPLGSLPPSSDDSGSSEMASAQGRVTPSPSPFLHQSSSSQQSTDPQAGGATDPVTGELAMTSVNNSLLFEGGAHGGGMPASAQAAAAAANIIAGDSSGEDTDEDNSSSTEESETSWKDLTRWLFQRLLATASWLLSLLWRLLELHLNRLVLLIIVIVCISDISAFNLVSLGFVVICLLIPGLHSVCYFFFNIWALVSIQAKMGFQLAAFTEENVTVTHNCTYVNGTRFNTIGEWIGYHKVDYIPRYIQGYLWVMVLISLRVVVRRNQRAVQEKYTKAMRQAQEDPALPASSIKPPPQGTHLFSSVSRQDADVSLELAVKYLCNHGFELFGVEMTLFVCALVISIRQDVFACLYAIYLVFLLLASASPRLQRYFLWPVFAISISLFILAQYFLLLGLPPTMCYTAPLGRMESNTGLVHWLYLSVPNVTQNKWFPVADFFLFISATIQLHNFRKNISLSGGNDGYTRLGDQPTLVADFTEGATWLDFFKRLIFHHLFWFSLAMMFIAATTRTSILSLGYMVLSFIFLWYGGSQLLLRPQRLMNRWRFLVGYNVAVIFIKTALQLWSCAFTDGYGDEKFNSYTSKLFATTCHHPVNSTTTATERREDQAGLYLDAVLLAMLLLQLRIFSSAYFTHVVHQLETIMEFAPDAMRMLLRLHHVRRRARRQLERSNLMTIRDRVLQLEKEPHLFQTLYGGTVIPKVVSHTDFKKRLSVGSGMSDTSGSMSSYCIGYDDPPAASSDGVHDSAADETGVSTDDDAGAHRRVHQKKRSKEGQKDKKKSFLRRVIDAVNDFLNKSVVYWLDSISYDYLYVETRLRRLRLLKHLDEAGQSSQPSLSADQCAPPGTVLATPAPPSSTESASKRSQKTSLPSWDADRDAMPSENINGEESVTEQLANALSETEEEFATTRGRARAHTDTGSLSALDFILKKRSLTSRSAATERLLRNEIADVIYMPARLSWALYYAILARTDVFCYLLLIVNHVYNGQFLTLPLPILVFMWALLDKPRPSPRFWVFAIGYIEAIVVIKFIFQSPLWPATYNFDPEHPAGFLQMAGLYRLPISLYTRATLVDVVLLLALTFHRGMLRLHGLWETRSTGKDKHGAGGEDSDDDAAEDQGAVSSPVSRTGDDGSLAVVEPDGDSSVRFRIEGDAPVKPATSSTKDSSLTRTVRFFKTAIDPRRGQGQSDYYVIMIFTDMVAFLVSIFGYSSFAEKSENYGAGVVSYIQQNNIPAMFLVLMLLQFIAIVIDRVIYLRKWLLGKLIFQIITLVVVHVWLFFILPVLTGRPFRDNSVAQAWYFFKCIYFAVSALQIVAGYPTRVLGHFLTKQPSLITAVLFMGFQAVPFLLELRALLDWSCTETVLSLMYWFKVEDIRASVYIIKSFRDDERNNPRQLGTTISFVVKLLAGGLGVTAIIIVLWLPLILMSFINSTAFAIKPYSGSLTVQVAGYEPVFRFAGEQTYLRNIATEKIFNSFSDKFPLDAKTNLSGYTYEDVSVFLVPSRSGSLWTISPPAKAALVSDLRRPNSTDLRISFLWTFNRHPNTGLALDTVTGSESHAITNDQRETLLTMLDSSQDVNVTFPNIFPAFVSAPSNGQSEVMFGMRDSMPVSVLLRRNTDNNTKQEWWSLYSETPPILPYELENPTDGFVEVVIFNRKIAAPQFSFLAGQGIIGLYVSLVLVIGQFLRLLFKNISHRIMFEDLPNPDAIHNLCKDILLVRESKRHSLEERLVGQLFLIYRDPLYMIKLTKETPIVE